MEDSQCMQINFLHGTSKAIKLLVLLQTFQIELELA